MIVSRLALGLALLALTACGGDPPSTTPSCDPGTFCECASPNDCPSGEVCLPFLDGLACQQAPDAGGDTSDEGDVSGDTTADAQADATDADDDTTETTDVETDAADDAADGSDIDATDADVTSDTGSSDASDAGDTASADTTDTDSDSGGPSISTPLSNPWIAVETNRFQDLSATPPRSQQIALVNTAGVFYHINSGDREMSSPTWSPDGQRLAFISRNAANRDLKVVDLTTGEFTTLLEEPPAGIANLDWDFSGQYIAFDAIAEFTGTASDTRDIYVVDVGTAEVTRLTTDSANDTGSRFDIAGNIWFTSNRDG
ncbi:MAG: PD40 domain-containing protein, partial [Myxococcales bacterium]|nr:PD40 domain-containing protein [Myxococcales bacterium]